MVEELRQSEYNIAVSISYFDGKIIDNITIPKKQIEAYEVSKDSVNYNYNLHLLSLSTINAITKRLLEEGTTLLNITLFENNKVISEKAFRVQDIHVVDEVDSMYNIQLVLISDLTYQFINSSKYSKQSVSGTGDLVLSYEIMQNILSKISSDEGTKLNTYYSDSGKTKNLYNTIRIPDTLNDLEIFDYLFEHYQPYLLKAYFILDDMHFGEKVSAPFNIIISNLCDLTGSYFPQNVKNILRYNIGTRQYKSNEPLLDYKRVYKDLTATLIIKNKVQNKVFKLQPLLDSAKSDEIKHIESNMDIKTIKSQLYMKKKLAEYKSTIESYLFLDLNIGDISFANVYNVIDNKVYDHLPVCIKYKFTMYQTDYFRLETHVDFARVPSNLLS